MVNRCKVKVTMEIVGNMVLNAGSGGRKKVNMVIMIVGQVMFVRVVMLVKVTANGSGSGLNMAGGGGDGVKASGWCKWKWL